MFLFRKQNRLSDVSIKRKLKTDSPELFSYHDFCIIYFWHSLQGGISGQIQHTAGMEESSMVIAINTDANAPINKFADYVITGDLNVVIPKMIQYYKKNSK